MEQTPLEKVLEVKCSLHPSNQSEVLHVSADIARHRACIKCLLNGKVQSLAALDLKSLFQMADDEDIILSFYPPLSDTKIFERLENIHQFSADKIIEQIENTISELRTSFNKILERLLKDSIKSMVQLGQQRREVLDLYKSLCEPNKLKEAVLQASKDKNESNLHIVLVEKCKNSIINANMLNSVISRFEASQQKFSLRMANEYSEEMQNLSLFSLKITLLNYSHSMLQQFSLVPSNLFDSDSRTKITRKDNNNHLDVKCIKENGNSCELFSKIALDSKAYYSFRFQFHQESMGGSPQFWIGLLNEIDKESATDCNLILYKEEDQDCDISKIVKGIALNSTRDGKNVHKEVEMRVHLASRTVKVADFPNYKNVVELADKRDIREGSQYLLFVAIGGFVNDHITLANVIISDRFDDSM